MFIHKKEITEYMYEIVHINLYIYIKIKIDTNYAKC